MSNVATHFKELMDASEQERIGATPDRDEHMRVMRTLAAYNDLLDEIRELRTMLAIAHAGVSLYHDDGELQDYATEPGIDWKRDPLDEIRRKLFERSMKAINKLSPGSPDAAPR